MTSVFYQVIDKGAIRINKDCHIPEFLNSNFLVSDHGQYPLSLPLKLFSDYIGVLLSSCLDFSYFVL